MYWYRPSECNYSETHLAWQNSTDEAKLAKLKNALEIPSLNQLWLTISLRPDPTYAEIVGTCKRYDKAMEQQRVNSGIGEAHTQSQKR